MPAITDKFGKASISTDYAVATTVKTTRTSGTTVLEAYDLSKFATDTPVYFITYKKTTDPVTGVVSVTNQTGWKALVNAGANTLTNLTLAPGYTDTGNAIGDFIECMPTSFWANSMIDALAVGHNPDGSFKTAALQAGLNIPSAVPSDYTVLAQTPTTVVANGNRSYTLTYPNVDYTDRLSPGMRLRSVRSAAAGVMCAALNGTNQYFSKTTPAGMTFTDDFTVSAWVKLSSYASAVIASRFNGTSGWGLNTNASGQVTLTGYNAGGGNARQVSSYQSLPLNKWVHVTAQLDMSAGTVSSTTCYIMFDGIDIPSSFITAGTNPTALIQAGNLEIGSWNGGLLPFPGKIAQAAIFSAKVTQATMRGYISQGLTGTEPTLVSAYSLSNSLNDLNTTNANNLTPNNGATTTNADAPWGGQANGTISSTVDYGIIQSVSYSAPNTTVVLQVAEGCTIPTSGGVASSSYSQFKSPYGFPGQQGKWSLITLLLTQQSSGLGAAVWGNVGFGQLTIPIGSWKYGYAAMVQANVSGANDVYSTLSESSSAESNKFMTAAATGSATGMTALTVTATRSDTIEVATAKIVCLLAKTLGAGTVFLRSDNGSCYILAENAYL